MKKVFRASLFLSLLIITTAVVTGQKKGQKVLSVSHSGGISGYTGFNGESTCNFCHYIPYGTKDTSILNISFVPNITNKRYVPGQTNTVNVTVESSTLNHFGFDCEILNSASSQGISVGTVTPLAAALTQTTMIYYPYHRNNVVHGLPALGTPMGNKNGFTFSFLWTAPVSDSAFVNVVGMAVNFDGSSAGDDIASNKSLALTPVTVESIHELVSSKSSLLVFPNPSSDIINLSYDLSTTGNVRADLMDFQGKVLAELFTCNQSAGRQLKTISLPSDLQSGIYTIRISSDEKRLVEKLVVIQARK